VVLNERLSILSEAGAEGAPDFVVEVLSPKTARLDRDNKRRVYATSGVRELWIIAPETRQIQVYLLSRDAANTIATHGENDTFSPRCFRGCVSARPGFLHNRFEWSQRRHSSPNPLPNLLLCSH
jgi:Uma2 family endonuclease